MIDPELERELRAAFAASGYELERAELRPYVLEGKPEQRGGFGEGIQLFRDLFVQFTVQLEPDDIQAIFDILVAAVKIRRDRGDDDRVDTASIADEEGDERLLRKRVPTGDADAA